MGAAANMGKQGFFRRIVSDNTIPLTFACGILCSSVFFFVILWPIQTHPVPSQQWLAIHKRPVLKIMPENERRTHSQEDFIYRKEPKLQFIQVRYLSSKSTLTQSFYRFFCELPETLPSGSNVSQQGRIP